MRTLFFIVAMSGLISVSAQKNVSAVSQTSMLGLQLPDGSRQDKRFISLTAASALLGMESKREGTAIRSTEVYTMPPAKASGYNSDSLVNALMEGGCDIAGVEGDDKFAWAVKEGKAYLVYFAMEESGTELYIGLCDRIPDLFGYPVEAMDTPVDPGHGQQLLDAQSPAGESYNMQQTGSVSAYEPAQNYPEHSRVSGDIENSGGPEFSSPPARSGGYTFTRTDFDDGWVSTEEREWVRVNRGNASVYLCHAVPYNSDNFSGTGVSDRDYYWDNYVAGWFRTETKQYRDDGEFVSSMKPKYVEGWGRDPVTGERRFIAMVLTVAPNTAYLTVAAVPDENNLIQLFPRANDKWSSDLADMSRYNKFAISTGDLEGRWQNGNTSTAQWYYVSPAGYEGYAGMTIASTSAEFVFRGDSTYESVHNGATGAVGAMSTFQQKYGGSAVISPWRVQMTNRWQGATQAFDAHFQAVSGGRLLYLNNNSGEKYLLVRTQ
ncbi:MAG: hypothetical protein QUS66_09555 [Bacteroidota bacterium]|jgi:hypothetical protein|nr:hypothetical protein [Bacteroidota bacterium]